MPDHESTDLISSWRRLSPRGVIFDFNGTLSDDEPLLVRIFAELFDAELGWELTEEYYEEHLLGLSDRDIIRHACRGRVPDVEVEAVTERLLSLRQEHYLAVVAEDNPITPDACDLVRALAVEPDTLVGIVTGARRAEVHPVLHGRGLLDLFDVVVTEDDVRHGKPDPEGFRMAAAALDLPGERCLVFEDSVAGVRAARAAGMVVVGVGTPATAARLRDEGVPVVGALTRSLLD